MKTARSRPRAKSVTKPILKPVSSGRILWSIQPSGEVLLLLEQLQALRPSGYGWNRNHSLNEALKLGLITLVKSQYKRASK